jgi:hypothetical protein
MNAQPVADARSVSETRAGRVPESRKEPTRQRIEKAAAKTPAKPENYCFSERPKEARCARNYRTRSRLQHTRGALRACAVFRAAAANWPASTPQKRRTKRQSQRERTPSFPPRFHRGELARKKFLLVTRTGSFTRSRKPNHFVEALRNSLRNRTQRFRKIRDAAQTVAHRRQCRCHRAVRRFCRIDSRHRNEL